MSVLTLEQSRTDYSLIHQYWAIVAAMREHESPSHELSSSKQTRGAITLTVAAVVLSSGLWGLWYTPTLGYEPRKDEQLGNIEFILEPNTSTVKPFDVEQRINEISFGIWGQTIVQDYNSSQDTQPAEIPPVFSIKILDSQGEIVRKYDNVTSAGDGERITVQRHGTFRVEVTNPSLEDTLQIQVRFMDVTKVVNHPLEAMGQWLTIISTPIFGLGAWFVASKLRHSNIV